MLSCLPVHTVTFLCLPQLCAEMILTKFSIYNDVWLKHYPVLRVYKENVKNYSKEKDTSICNVHIFNNFFQQILTWLRTCSRHYRCILNWIINWDFCYVRNKIPREFINSRLYFQVQHWVKWHKTKSACHLQENTSYLEMTC